MTRIIDNEIDAARYRKLQRWMSSNVKNGWDIVEQLGAVCMGRRRQYG